MPLSLAILSARTKKPSLYKKPTDPFFYDPNPRGIQVWYSLQNQLIHAHLQDGTQEYSGSGTSYKKALKSLENIAPEKYHRVICYMRVCIA